MGGLARFTHGVRGPRDRRGLRRGRTRDNLGGRARAPAPLSRAPSTSAAWIARPRRRAAGAAKTLLGPADPGQGVSRRGLRACGFQRLRGQGTATTFADERGAMFPRALLCMTVAACDVGSVLVDNNNNQPDAGRSSTGTGGDGGSGSTAVG